MGPIETKLLTSIRDNVRAKHKEPDVIIMHPLLFRDFESEVYLSLSWVPTNTGRLKEYRGIEILRSEDLNKNEMKVF